MVLQAASATFCLNKLTTLSFYMGATSLKFNLVTNKFEKSSEWSFPLIHAGFPHSLHHNYKEKI
jgi:hypothetical protein